jgi:signal transduction histidine kinase
MLIRKIQLAFGSAVVILLAVGAVSYRSMIMSSESDRWVRHTHEVLETFQILVTDMAQIESSSRGYVLTGQESYLGSYNAAVLSAGKDAAAVRSLTKDNLQQQLQLSALEDIMAQKIRFGDAVISLRGTKGVEAAANAIRSDRGQQIMTEFLGIVSNIRNEELRLLSLRSMEAERRLGQTKIVLLFGTVLGILIAVVSGLIVCRDIVARGLAEDALRKGEEALLKTVGELKRSNDELQQFAYVSSHDLQEPLRMVSSYTQLLAKRYKGQLGSDADEFITFAVDGCNRMQGLIQDLLAYSRAGTNGKKLCEASSEDALQKALINLRITVEQTGAIVTHDSLPAVRTDATQLTQVFQNLVGNAIKYHGAEPPRVHVSATRNGGHEWTFSVRDNGLGIAPQYFERIFILFQRLHGRDEFEGTGIGLAICKKILERLGGRIWVESQPEKGSTFYFALPETEEK